MSRKIFGGISLQDAQEIGFFDSDSTNFTAIKAPAALTGDVTLTLPDGDSTGSQALTSNGSGTLSWVSYLTTALTDGDIFVGNGSNVATGVTMSGDVTISNAGVAAIGSGVIIDADVNASAAVQFSKMENLTISRALVSDGSGDVSAATTTSTEIGFVNGVTSAIQTQIDGKAGTALDNLASIAINTSLISDTQNTDDLGSTAIAWKSLFLKTSLVLQETSGATTDAVTIVAPAVLAATYTLTLPVDDGATDEVLSTNGSGVLSWVSNAAVNSFQADWITADTATKVVTHSLATKDVIVQVYDKSDDQTIELDTVTRTDTNTVTLVSSSAPGASGFRVVILAT